MAEEEEGPLPKKQRTHIPPNEIKDYGMFRQYYGNKYGITIDADNKKSLTVPSRWATNEAISKIILFLQGIIPEWNTAFQVLPRVKLSEAKVGPILFEVIKPIVRLTSLKVMYENLL